MVYDHVSAPELPEGWFVRFIQPGDEEGILRVLTEAFSIWPKLACSVSPIEHLRWKLTSHPTAEKIHVVVESPEGIVGVRLDWGHRIKVGDHVRDVRLSIDRAVRPAFRMNGAMASMRNHKQKLHDEIFDMYMGYSSNAPGLENLQKYGARGVNRYRRQVDVLVCEIASRVAGNVPVGIRTVGAFDTRVDALWANTRDHFVFGVERTATHLNWRYADRRAGDYIIFAAEDGNRWLGYIVLRSFETTGYVADFLALPGRHDTVDALLTAALDHFCVNGQERVECWSEPQSEYRWALDRAGFREPRRSIGLSFRPLRFPAEEAVFLGDPNASFLFSAGDTDLV